jgi:hypothetical protein
VLPGDVADETGKAIPNLNCEGTANFAPNSKDIIVDMSLFSAAAGNELFKAMPNVLARTDDETIRCILRWKNGHYIVEPSLGKGPLSPIMALAWAMRNPNQQKIFSNYLNAGGESFASANPAAKNKSLQFEVKQMPGGRRGRSGSLAYFLNGTNGAFQVDLKQDGSKWIFWGARRLNSDQAQLASAQSTIPEIKNTAAQPAPIVVAATNSAGKKTQQILEKLPPAIAEPPEKIEVAAAAPRVVAQLQPAQVVAQTSADQDTDRHGRKRHRHHQDDVASNVEPAKAAVSQPAATTQPVVANSKGTKSNTNTSVNSFTLAQSKPAQQQTKQSQVAAPTVATNNNQSKNTNGSTKGVTPAQTAFVTPKGKAPAGSAPQLEYGIGSTSGDIRAGSRAAETRTSEANSDCKACCRTC